MDKKLRGGMNIHQKINRNYFNAIVRDTAEKYNLGIDAPPYIYEGNWIPVPEYWDELFQFCEECYSQGANPMPYLRKLGYKIGWSCTEDCHDDRITYHQVVEVNYDDKVIETYLTLPYKEEMVERAVETLYGRGYHWQKEDWD